MPSIPEYRKVRQYVLDSIAQHTDPSVRITSERELAALMNVSRLTVRYALKELIEDQWLYVKKGEGMFVNPDRIHDGVRYGNKVYKIMLMWTNGSMMTLDGFFIGILAEISSILKSYPVALQNSVFTGGSNMLEEEIGMYRPDAIIWIRPEGEKTFAQITKIRKKIPVCILGSSIREKVFSMTLDYEEAGKIAAEYFIGHNCRKVAFLGGNPEWKIRKEMLDGWKKAFAKNNEIYDNSLETSLETANRFDMINAILDRNPDGIFVYGSSYKFLDKVLAERKNMKLRILTDENNCGTYLVKRQPDAKLILAPPEMSRSAAKEIFKALTKNNYIQKEMLFHPSIKEKELKK